MIEFPIKRPPLVSILCITYNQEKYIEQALEGFLIQKTNFQIEIVIHDDASTDNTAFIIQGYVDKNPDLFVAIIQKENQYSKGVNPLFEYAIPKCSGKYIAICEGDDYWTDPLKLQKQVDFLEANPDYSLCFHDALVYWENRKSLPYYFCRDLQKTTFYLEDVIKSWFIPTASIILRRSLLFPLPNMLRDVYAGDYALLLFLALKGKIYYFNKLMSVYRQHDSNFTATISTSYIRERRAQFFYSFNEYTNSRYSRQITKKLKKANKSIRISQVRSLLFSFSLGKYLWKTVSKIYNCLR